MKIAGSRVLVTGGSTGIGRAIAEALVHKGAVVGITGRRRTLLQSTAEQLGALALPGDVASEADCKATVARFLEAHERLDVLVNNAGFGVFAPLVELETEQFDAVWATNVRGAMLMAREAARHFVARKSGHIVNISSTSGLKGGAESTAYSASKFALRGMTECWRDELRRHNVRVMLVNPSEVLTDFAAAAGYRQESSPRKLRPNDIAAAVVSALELDDRAFIPELSVWATNPF